VIPEPETVVSTRRQLHGVAESFLAGPQYRSAGTIRLAVLPDGFTGTAAPVAVHGTTLHWPGGSRVLAGPVSEFVAAAGLDAGPPPDDLYHPVAPLAPNDVLDLDAEAALTVFRALYAGAAALKAVLPEADPVLWPEHFDVSVAEGEVNYGVAAGDDYHPLPYAYVSPWAPRTGEFWNAPFGALHPLDLASDGDALAADIADFFRRAPRE